MTPIKIGDKIKSRIEKGIPIPMKSSPLSGEYVRILESMEKTNSILCEKNEIKRFQTAINHIHRRKTGTRYTCRQLGDKKRIWRVE